MCAAPSSNIHTLIFNTSFGENKNREKTFKTDFILSISFYSSDKTVQYLQSISHWFHRFEYKLPANYFIPMVIYAEYHFPKKKHLVYMKKYGKINFLIFKNGSNHI